MKRRKIGISNYLSNVYIYKSIDGGEAMTLLLIPAMGSDVLYSAYAGCFKRRTKLRQLIQGQDQKRAPIPHSWFRNRIPR